MNLDSPPERWQQRQDQLRAQLPTTPPAVQFEPGQRLWHVRREWCTYLLLSDWESSEVLFDDGEAARITTACLSLTDPDGAGPPPVPTVALAQFADYGLTPFDRKGQRNADHR